jgi:hypothetical protein
MNFAASSCVGAVVVSMLHVLPTLCSLLPLCAAPASGKLAALVPAGMAHIDLNTEHCFATI